MAGQRGSPIPVMDTTNSLKDQKEKPRFLIEVANLEKQLWALIHIKGLLHSDVHSLYRKVCSSYEKAILGDHEIAELQDVEYSLWKLHYRHIDEFRKRIKRVSINEEATKSVLPKDAVTVMGNKDNHAEGFKSFLFGATRFYQNLIMKTKKYCGLSEDFSFCRAGGSSGSIEPDKMQKLQFLCHRFLVCLGDLARYKEQYEKLEVPNQNWSVAVSHYLEATKIWPHSGNPQNQLAVLATYVGDEFLALYHCIRSLAVREPFPDAWNNLILLFEKNRSSVLQSFSNEAHFDVLNPSESILQINCQSSNDTSNCKMMQGRHEGSKGTHLWPLFIRMISFFLMSSSLEDFPCTFASTLRELDILMALDDAELNAALESYHHMSLARTGPFRTLQIVSVFIFVIENLINSPRARDSNNKNDSQQFELTREAIMATFIFMGRLAKRCLKANSLDTCPLLPALLVFSEWLVNILDQAETYGSDEKCASAMLYFFSAFLEIIRWMDNRQGEVKVPESIAIWEDYELRGFSPLARLHGPLDFSTNWAHADRYENGTQSRCLRIVNAAMNIVDRSNGRRRWICYLKSERKIYVPEKVKEKMGEESGKYSGTMAGEPEKVKDKPSNSPMVSNSVASEDEEVILFKPLTRHNSAPLYNTIRVNDQKKLDDTADQTVPADECLRRATSLLIAQNQAQGESSSFHSDLTNFRRNKPMRHQDEIVNTISEASSISSGPPSTSNSISAGPPSLNAWVVDRGSSSGDRVKPKRDMAKNRMPPIEETVSSSFEHISIKDADNSDISSRHEPMNTHNSSLAYSPPVPSAPFLPDNPVFFNGVPSAPVYNVLQVGGYSNWTGSRQPVDYVPSISGLPDGLPTRPTRRMTSSEWLRQYRENNNLDWTSHEWPTNTYAAVNTGNFYANDVSKSGLFEQFGVPSAVNNPLIYDHNAALHPGFPPAGYIYPGYQRPSPYICGAANEPEPLLQYLKEKEWLMQQDPALRGPSFMGS